MNTSEPSENILIDPDTGSIISTEHFPNYLNKFFAEISERVCDKGDARPYIAHKKVDSMFDFLPPEQYEIMLFAENIEVHSSSGIDGINMKICKTTLMHIPGKFTLLCANSMFSRYFPNEWTLSKFKLIPKAGKLSDPSNWKPISMTNIFSKLLEKLVHNQLLKYLSVNNLFTQKQFGFLPEKSTHEAIFKVVQNVYSNINNKKITGMILLDIAKAFNCIDHEILYVKMENAGFSGKVLSWFKSYLDRRQYVIINGKTSDILGVKNGIAQGTVLGPILLIFYINDIIDCTKYVNMSLFADDCLIHLSGNIWDSVHRKIQRDFDAIINWTLRHNLRLNLGKTKAMIISTKHRIQQLQDPQPFKLMGHDVQFVMNHVYLGIELDATMSLQPLWKSVYKRIHNKIFMLRKIRKFITFHAAILIYKQTILPIIDYAGFMSIACNNSIKEDFQILQNDILRICCRYTRSDKVSIARLHKECKIIGVEQRMRRQLLWLMFLLLKNKEYQRTALRETRSASKITLKCQIRYHTYMNIRRILLAHSYGMSYLTIYKNQRIVLYLKKHVSTLYKTFKPNGQQS